MTALSLILVNNGVSYGQLSILSFIPYPFSFKFITAPLLDTYFFSKIGKRKSYVIPMQFIISGLLIKLSFTIEDMIANKQVIPLAIFGFLIILMESQVDIAVEAWILTLLRE